MSATIPKLGSRIARDHIQAVIEAIDAQEFTDLIGVRIYEEPVPQQLQASAGGPYPLAVYSIAAALPAIYDTTDQGDALLRAFTMKLEVRDTENHYHRAAPLYSVARDALNKTDGDYEGGRVNSCVETTELPPSWRRAPGGEIYYSIGGLWTLETQKDE